MLTKAVIIIIGICQILFWGLPPLFASQFTADVFGVRHAGEFSYWARYTGMLNLTWGLLLLCAAANPVRNKLVVKFSIFLYAFTFVLTALMLFWFGELDLGKWAWWLPVVSSAAFVVLLIAFYPKEDKAADES